MRLKVCLSCVLLFLFFAMGNAQEVMKVFKAGDKFPEFELKDIHGKVVALKDLRGKYVYVDIWATWCGPCKAEIPYLKKLEKKMRRRNIVFVSISIDDNKANWEKMVTEKGLTGIQLHYDGSPYFILRYGVAGVPQFYLLDKEGKVLIPQVTRPSNPGTVKTLKSLKGIRMKK